MNKEKRGDSWSQEEDKLLADIVLEAVRTGKTKQKAWVKAADQTGRTVTACAFRWNAVLSKHYRGEHDQAKKERFNFTGDKEEDEVTTGIQQAIDMNTLELTDDMAPPVFNNPFDKLLDYVSVLRQEYNSKYRQYEELGMNHHQALNRIEQLEKELSDAIETIAQKNNEIVDLREQLVSLNDIKELVVHFQNTRVANQDQE